MNKIEQQYLNLLKDILENGQQKTDRTGTGTLSVFGRQLRHDFRDGFPLLTTKRMAFRQIITELLWFLRGDTNIKYLVENGCNIWNGDAYKSYLSGYKFSSNSISYKDQNVAKGEPWDMENFVRLIKEDSWFGSVHGNLGPIYGKQWRDWDMEIVNYAGKKYDSQNIDQIKGLIDEIKSNPDSRRLMVSAWNVGKLPHMVLPPCHYGFQIYTRELSLNERLDITDKVNKDIRQDLYSYAFNNPIYTGGVNQKPDDEERHNILNELDIPKRAISLMWNQRSVDTFLGLPFNIASYGLLLMIIAKEVNMIPDELVGNLGDTHLYLNHLEQAKEQLSRNPRQLPNVKTAYEFLDSPNFSFVEKIPKLQWDMFILNDYDPHPTIKGVLSN